jgi:chromosome condensin MukBEF MukE localization factor
MHEEKKELRLVLQNPGSNLSPDVFQINQRNNIYAILVGMTLRKLGMVVTIGDHIRFRMVGRSVKVGATQFGGI